VLPAGLTASCLHGPGKAAERAAYRRLQAWLDRSGHRRAGPYREIYYRVDDRDALTEIQLPIEPTRGDVA
jgi:effector-binding domain-containing protein